MLMVKQEKLPSFLEDQIFTGPLLLMLRYKGLSLNDPLIQQWGNEKMNKIKDQIEDKRLKAGILRHKNKHRHKSTRIIRSFAKKLQMAGRETMEDTRTREFCIFVYDYLVETNNFFLTYTGICPGNERQAFDTYLRPALHYFLPIISSSLDYYKSGFILKSGISYVDILIAEQLQRLNYVDKEILADHPDLLCYKRRIFKILEEGSKLNI